MWADAASHDASPSATRGTIESLAAMHDIGRPIVAGYAGGMSALAALASGAASAVAHGIGQPVRVALPGLDESLKSNEIGLLRSARGGSRLVSSAERDRCPRGFEDMLADPRRHEVRQALVA